jgi:hypothetical protein
VHFPAPDSPAPAAAFAAAGLHEAYIAALHAARVSERLAGTIVFGGRRVAVRLSAAAHFRVVDVLLLR